MSCVNPKPQVFPLNSFFIYLILKLCSCHFLIPVALPTPSNPLMPISALLNRNLNTLLLQMEKNKEWADLGNCVGKIVRLLEEHPSPYILQK